MATPLTQQEEKLETDYVRDCNALIAYYLMRWGYDLPTTDTSTNAELYLDILPRNAGTSREDIRHLHLHIRGIAIQPLGNTLYYSPPTPGSNLEGPSRVPSEARTFTSLETTFVPCVNLQTNPIPSTDPLPPFDVLLSNRINAISQGTVSDEYVDSQRLYDLICSRLSDYGKVTLRDGDVGQEYGFLFNQLLEVWLGLHRMEHLKAVYHLCAYADFTVPLTREEVLGALLTERDKLVGFTHLPGPHYAGDLSVIHDEGGDHVMSGYHFQEDADVSEVDRLIQAGYHFHLVRSCDKSTLIRNVLDIRNWVSRRYTTATFRVAA